MRVRDSIFDSRAERELFRELDSRLIPRLRLMAQTPLRSLIHLDDDMMRRLKRSHRNYFLAAAVDYTFIYPDGRPLLSIEFDGIGGGYSRGRDYVATPTTLDPNRDWKMRFKLAAADRAGYPLFVISGDEIAHLDEQTSLTIVDGIVGQIFSRWEERRIFDGMLEQDAEMIAEMDPAWANERIADLVLQAGVISDFEFDPLTILVAEAHQSCAERFGFGFGAFYKPWLYDPPLPEDRSRIWPTPELLEQRIRAMKTANRVGAHVGVSIGDGRYVDATAWMRNIGQAHGLTPELIIEQVAELLAIRRTVRLAEEGRLSAETSTTFETATPSIG